MITTLSASFDINGQTLNVEFWDKEPSAELRQLMVKLDKTPSALEWSEFYVKFLLEFVVEWDVEDDDAPVPITDERLRNLPVFILKEIVFGILPVLTQNNAVKELVTNGVDKHILVLRQIFHASPPEIQKFFIYEVSTVLRPNFMDTQHLQPKADDDILTSLNKQQVLSTVPMKEFNRFPDLETWEEVEELILTKVQQGMSPAFLASSLLLMIDTDIRFFADPHEAERGLENMRRGVMHLREMREKALPENRESCDAQISWLEEQIEARPSQIAQRQSDLVIWNDITAERLAMQRLVGIWGDCIEQ